MNDALIISQTKNQIRILTVNRPDKLNALNSDVMEALNTAIDDAIGDPQIRSIIITGAGEKAFIAGADIGGFGGLTADEGAKLSRKGQTLFLKIEGSPKPIVAAVNGFALGGGCELALACHFRVASEKAKFGQPEVNLGLIPGYGGTQRLTRLIGKGRAIEMMITGNMIDAVTAFNYGLVNHVVPPGSLIPMTLSILELVTTKAPLAVKGCLDAVNLATEPGREGYHFEAETFGKLIVTADAKEGIAAFLEKRKPVFNGS